MIFSCVSTFSFAVSDTSVVGIAPRAPMKTGAGVCVCPVQHRARIAGVTRAVLPVSLDTSLMVPGAKNDHFCVYFVYHEHTKGFRYTIGPTQYRQGLRVVLLACVLYEHL